MKLIGEINIMYLKFIKVIIKKHPYVYALQLLNYEIL